MFFNLPPKPSMHACLPGEEQLAIERAAAEEAAAAAEAAEAAAAEAAKQEAEARSPQAEQMLKRFEQLRDMQHSATKRRRKILQAAAAEAAAAEATEPVEGRKADVLLACPARRPLCHWPKPGTQQPEPANPQTQSLRRILQMRRLR